MTDWSQLDDAQGSSEDIPALFDNLAATNREKTWDELWARLCHQGSTWPASYASLPLLWRIAMRGHRDDQRQAVCMAGTIVQGASRQGDADELRPHTGLFPELAAIADAHLQASPQDGSYVEVMKAMLALSGHVRWCDDLDDLTDSVFAVHCPHCGTRLSIAIGDHDNDSAVLDWHDGRVHRRPLTPGDPTGLPAPGNWLFEIAERDGQQSLLRGLPYVFGRSGCGPCGGTFDIASAVEQFQAESIGRPFVPDGDA